jgi:regulatory protein YycI of two-component signal transduction system YycFG
MKHSRIFLTFILILLLINVLFFVSWYLLDVQGKVKNLIEQEAGKALKGQMKIGNLSISERQIFAQNIQFTSTDGTFKFTVTNARCRYNLLKFVFSGFKIRNSWIKWR